MFDYAGAKGSPLAGEYGKFRVHFPEENIHLNLTARLLDEYGFKGIASAPLASVMDNSHIHPRSITERLLRRIIAKLLRVSALRYYVVFCCLSSLIGDRCVP